MNITIWSDFVCPFCYIGEAQLAEAINHVDYKQEIIVEYKSFQLDPDGKFIEGLTYEETFSRLKGISIAEARAMVARIEKMAANVGVTINYDEAVYANTFNGHRLFQFAKEEGAGNEFFNRLYKAHFDEGANLEDFAVLQNLAKEIGLDSEAAERVLMDPSQYKEIVKNDLRQAQINKIQGVPFYVFEGKYGVSGAQPVENFRQILEKVRTDQQS